MCIFRAECGLFSQRWFSTSACMHSAIWLPELIPCCPTAMLQVNPHRIKDMDVQFMARLSQAVPVIPIMAKVQGFLPSIVSKFIVLSIDWSIAATLHISKHVSMHHPALAAKP
jgi:hypothetical protein